MSTTLLSAQLSPREVEILVDHFDNGAAKLYEQSIHKKTRDFELTAHLKVDLRGAKPHYRNGALKYGPIDVNLLVKDFRVMIDWHNALGIPKKVCIHLKDPCGNTIFKECISFNLGVTTLVLLSNVPIANRFDVEVLDVSLRDKDAGSDYFALTADIPFAGMLFNLLVEGFTRGAIALVGDFVDRLLRSVLGSGELAKLIIRIIKGSFAIVDAALDFIGDLIALALRPLDEALHAIFGEKLEIVLNKKGFPKRLTLVDASANRPAVMLPLSVPPRVDLRQSGMELEVYK